MNLKNYIKISRPDHWIKNLFIYPGSFFAAVLVSTKFTSHIALNLFLEFVATCFIASANYVINEWLDAETDRYHPVKKNRPVVAGKMNGKIVLLEYLLFIAAGLAISIFLELSFFLTEVLLLVMGVFYNVKPLRTKDIPYLDVISESFNNAIRLMLGWFAIAPNYFPPASIVIGFWFGGAFLMAIKRFAEYRMIHDPKTAGLYRASFKYYTERSLLISSFFYAMCSVFFIGIFLVKYRIELILAMPLLCGLFCLYFKISFKNDSAVQKPEKLYREKFLMLYVTVFVITVAVLMFIRIPQLNGLLNTSLIKAV
jgi:4-hydroxybenzoate polyprenyltransferase